MSLSYICLPVCPIRGTLHGKDTTIQGKNARLHQYFLLKCKNFYFVAKLGLYIAISKLFLQKKYKSLFT